MNGADLDDISQEELVFLARMNAGPVDEGAVGTIEILERQHTLGIVPMQDGVLARAPNAVRRFLIFQVDIDRLFVGTADKVEIGIDGKVQADFLATQDGQLGR